MHSLEKIEYEKYYHINNYTARGLILFRFDDNYNFSLKNFDKFITPFAYTYTRVLMSNLYHLSVRIKEVHPDCIQNTDNEKYPSLPFSKLFNYYAKSYNKYYHTQGTLFVRPFKRKLIDSDDFPKKVVLYIHNNPAHHDYYSYAGKYSWSTYLICISAGTSKLKLNEVIEL